MLTVAIPKRNKLQNIIVLTPKDGCGWPFRRQSWGPWLCPFSACLKDSGRSA